MSPIWILGKTKIKIPVVNAPQELYHSGKKHSLTEVHIVLRTQNSASQSCPSEQTKHFFRFHMHLFSFYHTNGHLIIKTSIIHYLHRQKELKNNGSLIFQIQKKTFPHVSSMTVTLTQLNSENT